MAPAAREVTAIVRVPAETKPPMAAPRRLLRRKSAGGRQRADPALEEKGNLPERGVTAVVKFFRCQGALLIREGCHDGEAALNQELIFRFGGVALRRNAARNQVHNAAAGLQDLLADHLFARTHKSADGEGSRAEALGEAAPPLPEIALRGNGA